MVSPKEAYEARNVEEWREAADDDEVKEANHGLILILGRRLGHPLYPLEIDSPGGEGVPVVEADGKVEHDGEMEGEESEERGPAAEADEEVE